MPRQRKRDNDMVPRMPLEQCRECFAVKFLPPDYTTRDLAMAQKDRYAHFLEFESADALRTHMHEQYQAYNPTRMDLVESEVAWYRTEKRERARLAQREREIWAQQRRADAEAFAASQRQAHTTHERVVAEHGLPDVEMQDTGVSEHAMSDIPF